MTQETLSEQETKRLLARQKELQSEAREVLEKLDLYPPLQKIGKTRKLGSSALGLMVWRDIDLGVSCPQGVELQQILQKSMFPLYNHPSVQQIRFINDSGQFRLAGNDERYYFAVHYRAPQKEEWKIDISFWTNTDEHPEPLHDAVALGLTEEYRLTILWIKDIWHQLPDYRTKVYSIDIYDAVLNQGVQTPREFDEYLRARGKPTRG